MRAHRWFSLRRHLGADEKRLAETVVELAAGAVVPAILGFILAQLLSRYASESRGAAEVTGTTLILFLAVAFAALLLSAIIYVRALTRSLHDSSSYTVNVWRDQPSKHTNLVSAFDYCSAIAKSAKRSIMVFGPHFVEHLDLHTESHTDYLERGMSAAIARHMDSEDEDKPIFNYTRIIQIDVAETDVINANGALPYRAVRNDGLARHLDKVLKLHKESEDISIEIYALAYVPSFPSVLIVDDTHLFFSLPTYLSRTTSRETSISEGLKKALVDVFARQNGSPDALLQSMASMERAASAQKSSMSLSYDFVLGIEDKSGRIPRMFNKLVHQFKTESSRITEIQGIPPFSEADAGDLSPKSANGAAGSRGLHSSSK